MFADDSAVFADNDVVATDTLYDIATIAQSYGLKINVDKTKVLTTDGSRATVYLNGVQIEQVQEFKYLGSLIKEKKVASSNETHARIGQAAHAFASLKWFVWRKNNISLMTKIRLFRTLVIPILLYGSETCTLLKTDLDKLETFQLKCLRQILGISLWDRITNNAIRTRCQQQPSVKTQIQQRRLRWFGHVCRMDINRIPHQLLFRQRPTLWKIQHSAPKKTWTKHVEEDLKNQRLDLNQAKLAAMDRGHWRGIVEKARLPAAPTAAYWLRGHPQPNAS
ncbi:uncharacterized protein LOC111631815 [Centruroides sculpturatus]|uniref:uncharacterized protein LOC111631815 n=1 Tax=Centruroides sculpturatus TaxID=218467 RepID=UPI000C6E249A|nr:uncharacterized protein LOC111631815 [Centruroides sculpturatus]